MIVSVELAAEAVDSIICDELEFQYLNLKGQLEDAKAGRNTLVFSTVRDIEIKEIERHIKALKCVLGLYTVGGKYGG